MSAIKYDEGKPDFTLIPQKALLEVARVATKGGIKYPGFNYSKELSPRRYVAASLRHINQWLSGEDIDEIGTHHLANAAMSILMGLDNILNETVEDDRNKIYKQKFPSESHDIYIIDIFHVDPNGNVHIKIDRNWKLLPIYHKFDIINQNEQTVIISPYQPYVPKIGDKLQ